MRLLFCTLTLYFFTIAFSYHFPSEQLIQLLTPPGPVISVGSSHVGTCFALPPLYKIFESEDLCVPLFLVSLADTTPTLFSLFFGFCQRHPWFLLFSVSPIKGSTEFFDALPSKTLIG